MVQWTSVRQKTGTTFRAGVPVHERKFEQAIPVFSEAAQMSAYAAMPYFNLCATLFNMKRGQEALAACDRALASDPSMSDAYFVKASVLFGQGRMEDGKYIVPLGTTESLNRYLEYAPFGQHTAAVRSMIDKMNAGVEMQYKPAKK